MADKVYTPEVIEENPFPNSLIIPDALNSSPTNGNFTSTTVSEQKFPNKSAAFELLSTALNTRSRNILQEFDLLQSGGFKVGDFKEGITGDLKITPNGITARDKAGLTTFGIDGTTGDATFRGSVQAADFMIADENGLISLNNFVFGDVGVTVNLSTTTTTWVTSNASKLTITLSRPTHVLFLGTLGTIINTNTSDGIILRVNIDSGAFISRIVGNQQYTAKLDQYISLPLLYAVTLPAGTHNAYIQFAAVAGNALTTVKLTGFSFSYFTLGS